LCDWPLANPVDTLCGRLIFDPKQQNFGPDPQKIKQIHNGQWVVVYSVAFAAPGAKLEVSPRDLDS
jgi:hypothetical protein